MKSIDPNSLIAMPEHILETIFNFLGLADRKSFSETCKSFNKTIFGSRKNLNKIWLDLNPDNMSDLSRTYISLLCTNKLLKFPYGYWKSMSPTIKSLKIKENYRCIESIVAEVTNFENLTHLDIDNLKNFSSQPERDMKNIPEPIKMEKLEFLRINCQLFAYLQDRFIDFNKKLRTLKILIRHEYIPLRFRLLIQDEISDKIRALLIRQTNLRNLHFDIQETANAEVVCALFDQPLVIPSMLHQIKFNNYFDDATTRCKNFQNFIKSQSELTVIDVDLKFFMVGQFKESVLERPLKQQKLIDKTYTFGYNGSYELKTQLTHCDRPNMSTKKLVLIVDKHLDEIVNFSVDKFPNVSEVELKIYGQLHMPNLAQLNALEKLTSLKLECKDMRILDMITLAGLRSLEIKLLETVEFMNFLNFLSRHQSVESLRLTGKISTILSKDKIPKLLQTVAKNLISFQAFDDFAGVNTFGIKCLNQDTGIYHIDLNYFLRSICSTIKIHSRPGFHFIYSQIEIFKRYDGEVVQKVGGRWQKLAN